VWPDPISRRPVLSCGIVVNVLSSLPERLASFPVCGCKITTDFPVSQAFFLFLLDFSFYELINT
ncbi:MAG: hypothetical protein K1W02_04540, partial [Muribaculaceae bacterium]